MLYGTSSITSMANVDEENSLTEISREFNGVVHCADFAHNGDFERS